MGHLRSLKMISTDIPIFYQWLIATSHTSYHLRDTVTQGLADFTNPKSRFWILRKGCSAVTEGLKKSWRPWDTGRWTLYDAKVISVNALQVYDSRPAIDMAAIQQWYQSLIWLSKLKNKKKTWARQQWYYVGILTDHHRHFHQQNVQHAVGDHPFPSTVASALLR